MAKYAFALRPRWWLSHLLAVALISAMIWACLWQRSRLLDVRERNSLISERSVQEIVELDSLVAPTATLADGAGLEFRPVTASGEYRREDEVLIRGRSLNGAPGSWVATPLHLDDGRAVLVNRGWVPRSFDPDAPRPDVDPVANATVVGWLRPTQEQLGLGARDAPTGTLSSLARVDIDRVQQQVDYPLLPVWLQLDEQQPAGGELPVPVELPPLDEGSHFSYQVQWAIYATIGLFGYPMILRRVANSRARGEDDFDGLEHETAAPL